MPGKRVVLGGVAPDGLARLIETGRTDFMAWIFFHIPALRALASDELRRAVMGPRHGELAELVDGLPAVGWLAPGERTSERELQALVDEHLRAMAVLGLARRGAGGEAQGGAGPGAQADAARQHQVAVDVPLTRSQAHHARRHIVTECNRRHDEIGPTA